MSKEVINENQNNDVVIGFNSKSSFAVLWQMAQAFASSTIVPKTFQESPANCMIGINMAIRMNADPLMVMQNLVIVHGNPTFSSKFLVGTFNSCGKYTSIKYEFFGEVGTDEWGCRAHATEKSTGEKLVGPDVTVKMAKGEGWWSKKDSRGNECSKWQTMPQLMLQYRAAAFFIRTTAPEISLGLMTSEEMEDTIEVQPLSDGSYSLHEQVADAQALIENTPVTTVDITLSDDSAMPEAEPAVVAPAAEQKPAEKRKPGF